MGDELPGPRTGGVIVGVVVNNVGGYSRGVLRGIASFAVSRAWTLRVAGVNLAEVDENDPGLAGIIVQASTAEQAARFAAAGGGGGGCGGDGRGGVPVVNVSSSLPDPRLPTVITDDVAVGRLGAEHFLRLGYRTLAFYGPDRRAFVETRYGGFARRCAEAGVEARYPREEAALARVLAELPRPLGVMGCNDRAALAVLDACRGGGGRGTRVPEDVAVLGVDDDDLVQALAYPPMSTINTARDRVGFEAAAMLERLMLGRMKPPGLNSDAVYAASEALRPATVLVAPKGVVARRSTDATAIADADVAEASRYIHTHAGRPISVDDVAAAATVSRRQLERRFRATMGHTLLEEITRCRVDRARQLLTDTDLTLEQVATASGFTSASYLSVVFKRSTGQTPQRYRDAYRVVR